MVTRSRSLAFTLIELLIVVAIIAILAAIAVPNFLEAQTRSKTSRVRADMRSIATALEAYAVDHNNNYPLYHYTGDFVSGGQTVNQFFLGGSVTGPGMSPPFNGNPLITSPVAYMTSLPNDALWVAEGDDPPESRSFLYVNWSYYGIATGANPASVLRWFGKWRLTSGGPDKSRGLLAGDLFNTLYDPTNGTISLGQIHRTQLSSEGKLISYP